MRDVYVIGVGMTRFGKFQDMTLKQLSQEAVEAALKHAGIEKNQLQVASVGNAYAGIATGQESIRGQVVLRAMGIGGLPVFNIENACASSASAFMITWMDIALGLHDIGLAMGMEKMYLEDREKRLALFSASMDQDVLETLKKMAKASAEAAAKKAGKEGDKGGKRSMFMDVYAMAARWHMEKYGTTQRQLAIISAKNHQNSALNPLSQYQQSMTVEEVLSAPEISYPLTRPMCAPVGDGASAAILCSGEMLKRLGAQKPVKVRAVVQASGRDRGMNDTDIGEIMAGKAYQMAGIGPEDIDVAEVHDATAFGELRAIENMKFCPAGEGGPFSEAGNTALGGRIPVNPSGGLESKGHPVGATGVAQIAEIVWQLRGETGKRQVKGARIGLTENGGGNIGLEEAAINITILERV
jgi:acetyl-CoA acetyltransferase